MDGAVTKLNIQPGVNRNVTQYQAEGYWTSADKVRWSNQYAEKIGGWQQKNADSWYYGVGRSIHPWSALDGSKLVALGTHNSLWVEEGGTWQDVTPLRSSVVAASAFSGTSGSNSIHVSLTAHGAQKNDLLFVGTSVELAAWSQTVSSGHYHITSAGTNHFDFSLPSDQTATSSYSGENAVSCVFQFLITAGLKSNGALFGWGSDGWGQGTYGTAGTGGVATELRQWSLANWGEDLIACQKNGSLYYRETSAGGRASIVNNAPTQNNVMFLSNPSRQVVLCGTCVAGGNFDPMLVRWSDTEDYTTWTAAATNGSGDYRIPTGSIIVGAIDTKKEHVIFTDEGAYSMAYQGPPDYYGFSRLGANCGLVGMNAGVDLNGVLYWMSEGSFYVYDGTIRQLGSTLDEAVFSRDHPYRLNLDQKEKVFCGVNTEFSEIWWFYPAGESIENSRYIIHNYADDTWYDGNLVRTTWTGSKLYDTPIATAAASVSSSFFEHETGYNDGTSIMSAFLKSGAIQIGDGGQMMFIDQIIPDIDQTDNVKFNLEAKKYPQAAESTKKGPFTVNSLTGKKSVRIRGRQMNLEIGCTLANANFRLGAIRVRAQPDGER